MFFAANKPLQIKEAFRLIILNTRSQSNTPECGDTTGSLPPCGSVASAYVPMQRSGTVQYDRADALANGTLFPNLNLPFHLKTNASKVPDSPLAALESLDFVVWEMALYLDTHPDDQEAFDLFKQYLQMHKQAKESYENTHGPLSRATAANGNKDAWLSDKWPWNYE